MPTLNQLECSIELGPGNTKLKEYGTKYRNGHVETFIAVTDSDIPFTIHLKTKGYIAPGIALFVFMDGVYQCNRNRIGLKLPGQYVDPNEYEVQFHLRQKEEKSVHGAFIGSDWTFKELDRVSADKAPALNPQFLNNIGTIEVVVMRCKPALDDVPTEVSRGLKRGRISNYDGPADDSEDAHSTSHASQGPGHPTHRTQPQLATATNPQQGPGISLIAQGLKQPRDIPQRSQVTSDGLAISNAHGSANASNIVQLSQATSPQQEPGIDRITQSLRNVLEIDQRIRATNAPQSCSNMRETRAESSGAQPERAIEVPESEQLPGNALTTEALRSMGGNSQRPSSPDSVSWGSSTTLVNDGEAPTRLPEHDSLRWSDEVAPSSPVIDAPANIFAAPPLRLTEDHDQGFIFQVRRGEAGVRASVSGVNIRTPFCASSTPHYSTSARRTGPGDIYIRFHIRHDMRPLVFNSDAPHIAIAAIREALDELPEMDAQYPVLMRYVNQEITAVLQRRHGLANQEADYICGEKELKLVEFDRDIAHLHECEEAIQRKHSEIVEAAYRTYSNILAKPHTTSAFEDIEAMRECMVLCMDVHRDLDFRPGLYRLRVFQRRLFRDPFLALAGVSDDALDPRAMYEHYMARVERLDWFIQHATPLRALDVAAVQERHDNVQAQLKSVAEEQGFLHEYNAIFFPTAGALASGTPQPTWPIPQEDQEVGKNNTHAEHSERASTFGLDGAADTPNKRVQFAEPPTPLPQRGPYADTPRFAQPLCVSYGMQQSPYAPTPGNTPGFRSVGETMVGPALAGYGPPYQQMPQMQQYQGYNQAQGFCPPGYLPPQGRGRGQPFGQPQGYYGQPQGHGQVPVYMAQQGFPHPQGFQGQQVPLNTGVPPHLRPGAMGPPKTMRAPEGQAQGAPKTFRHFGSSQTPEETGKKNDPIKAADFGTLWGCDDADIRNPHFNADEKVADDANVQDHANRNSKRNKANNEGWVQDVQKNNRGQNPNKKGWVEVGAGEWDNAGTQKKSDGKNSNNGWGTQGGQNNAGGAPGWGSGPQKKSDGRGGKNSNNEWDTQGGQNNAGGAPGWGNEAQKSGGNVGGWDTNAPNNGGGDGGWGADPKKNSGSGWGTQSGQQDEGDGGWGGDQNGQNNAGWSGGDQKSSSTKSQGWGHNDNQPQQSDTKGWGGSQDSKNNDKAWGGPADQNNGASGWDTKSRSSSVKSTRSHHRRSDSISVASGTSAEPNPLFKPYWKDWTRPIDKEVADDSDSNASTVVATPREVYQYPAEPLPPVPSNKAKSASHVVQTGRGAAYDHLTRRPEYIDAWDKPYAVFSFKYRSPEALGSLLKTTIDVSDIEKVKERVEKDMLLAMPKHKLVEELMAKRGISGGGKKEGGRSSGYGGGGGEKGSEKGSEKGGSGGKGGYGW
ncbi:uncharacterized protein LTR77_001183 [Saxophila tyrrhenica]|uniref:Uncharacterized protein n=1 Tax=Saxophila tyrrhenica TaxID=1690608 RepID=A0AAV9PJS8_9PEZI|nr:hypothetical protein LTR77_001183 [Saxophila tyrrhenica]